MFFLLIIQKTNIFNDFNKIKIIVEFKLKFSGSLSKICFSVLLNIIGWKWIKYIPKLKGPKKQITWDINLLNFICKKNKQAVVDCEINTKESNVKVSIFLRAAAMYFWKFLFPKNSILLLAIIYR